MRRCSAIHKNSIIFGSCVAIVSILSFSPLVNVSLFLLGRIRTRTHAHRRADTTNRHAYEWVALTPRNFYIFLFAIAHLIFHLYMCRDTIQFLDAFSTYLKCDFDVETIGWSLELLSPLFSPCCRCCRFYKKSFSPTFIRYNSCERRNMVFSFVHRRNKI